MTTPDSNKTLLTPISVKDGDISFYLPRYITNKKKVDCCDKYPPPYTILTISIFQVVIYFIVDNDTYKSLRFDPNNQFELWRFFTYIFLHGNWQHLILNVIIQCMFAWYLENHQGNLRVGVIYVVSGITGALGAACVLPDLIVGASAGVYALLISHISHIVLNFQVIKYKVYQCVCVFILVVSDVAYNLGHHYTNVKPRISWAAHFVGALSGFLLGFILYKCKNDKSNKTTLIKALFTVGLILFISLFFLLILTDFQIRKCTPTHLRKFKYTYFC